MVRNHLISPLNKWMKCWQKINVWWSLANVYVFGFLESASVPLEAASALILPNTLKLNKPLQMKVRNNFQFSCLLYTFKTSSEVWYIGLLSLICFVPCYTNMRTLDIPLEWFHWLKKKWVHLDAVKCDNYFLNDIFCKTCQTFPTSFEVQTFLCKLFYNIGSDLLSKYNCKEKKNFD